jgi:CRP/FNR family transcriptional regulator
MAVMRLVDSHPEVAKAALKLMSSHQRTLGIVVEDLALRDVTARIARLLLACAGCHEHILDHAHHACARITHRMAWLAIGSTHQKEPDRS